MQEKRNAIAAELDVTFKHSVAMCVPQAKAAGLRTLSYTVNDSASVQVLMDLKTDGIITDRVDLFNPHAI